MRYINFIYWSIIFLGGIIIFYFMVARAMMGGVAGYTVFDHHNAMGYVLGLFIDGVIN